MVNKEEDRKYEILSFILLTTIFLFRLWYSGKVELSPDECYYWEWSRNLDWSYSDQGPVLGLIIYFFTHLFAKSTELTVRLGALLGGLGSNILAYFLSKEIFRSSKASFFTLLLLNVVSFTSVGTLLMTPDNPQVFFWALSVYLVHRITRANSSLNIYWFLLGLSLGLGVMSKYTGILFFPCLLLFFLRRELKDKRSGLFLALFIAMLVCLPALVWNIKYNFSTYKYLAGPVVWKPYKNLNLLSLPKFISGQAGIVTPFVFFLFVYLIFSKKKIKNASSLSLNWLFYSSFPVLFFFTFLSLFAEIQDNWPIPGYFSLFVLTGGYICQETERKKLFSKAYFVFAYLFAFLVTSLFLFQTLHPFLPLPKGTDPADGKVRGWRILGNEVSQIVDRQEKPFFLLSNYYWVAAEIAFYTNKQYRVHCLQMEHPLRQYALWNGLDKFIGYDAIYIKQGEGIETKFIQSFDILHLIKIINVPLRETKKEKIIKTFSVYYGKRFRGNRLPP